MEKGGLIPMVSGFVEVLYNLQRSNSAYQDIYQNVVTSLCFEVDLQNTTFLTVLDFS